MKKIYFLIILMGLITLSNQAQEVTVNKDLKVGLVFSGGGAKGFAHIGVLKALEEAGITVDYIGGTSMGAIVGGLYASGYSAQEIIDIAHDLNFENYMDEEISRSNKPFHIKENDDKYVIEVPVKNFELSLPSGFTQGVQIMNKVSKYTQHVSDIKDFNDLPIPFLCVATNLENGEEVILNHGDLSEAIRASAAYPTVVKPIQIDQKLLVDGGLVNNFPVEEVKSLGADYLIGVDVGSKNLYKKEELQSLVKILEQMVSYQMITPETLTKENKVNLYINPVSDQYNTFSFDQLDSIIELGYKTALTHMDKLKAIAKKQHRPKKPTSKVVILDRFIVKSIQFSGSKNFNNGYLLDKMQLKVGKIISFEELSNGIDRLWATDNFSKVQHRVVMDGGEGSVYVDLVENDVLSHIRIGGTYDELFKGGILVNLSSRRLIFGNDFLSADAVIGENFRYNIHYFIDNGINLSTGIQSTFQRFDYNANFNESFSTFAPENNFNNLGYSNFTNKLNFQFVYRDNFATGFGAEHQLIRAKNKNPQYLRTIEMMHVESLYGYMKYDSFDHRMFPKTGFTFQALGHWFLGMQNNLIPFKPYMQGQLLFGYAFPLGKHFSVQVESEAGLSFSDNTHPYLDFHLGGSQDNELQNFRSFYGYPFAHIGGKSYLKSGVNIKYEFYKNAFIGVAGQAARVEDNILDDLALFEDTHTGYSVFLGAKTPAGPIKVTLAHAPRMNDPIFTVKFGYWF
ncbi:MAG: hypothetical protein CR968_06150 [Flavobacteriia bacterium]|nr:MAG: hypothetical protein CR968_06150 [Flavobacteriia bacterium]